MNKRKEDRTLKRKMSAKKDLKKQNVNRRSAGKGMGEWGKTTIRTIEIGWNISPQTPGPQTSKGGRRTDPKGGHDSKREKKISRGTVHEQ